MSSGQSMHPDYLVQKQVFQLGYCSKEKKKLAFPGDCFHKKFQFDFLMPIQKVLHFTLKSGAHS